MPINKNKEASAVLPPSKTVSIFLKAFLLLYTALLSFPFRLSPLDTGLDPSWVFAINYFFDKHYIFGRDIIWTYGPLGFLAYPLDIGANLAIATVFHLAVWVMFLSILAFLFIRNHLSLMHIFLFTMLYAAGQALYFLGFIGYDYCITFLILLLLSCSLFLKKWYVPYLGALALITVICFMKFTSAISSVIALTLYLFSLFFTDRKKALPALILSFIVPVLFTAGYLIYNPSLDGMYLYLRGAYELTSGYSSAMSLAGDDTEVMLALFLLLVYLVIAYRLFKQKDRTFYLTLIFSVPLFMAFKHGFARQDSHVLIYFSTFSLLLSLILLFSDIRRVLWQAVAVVIVTSAVWVSVYGNHVPVGFVGKGVTGLFSLNSVTGMLNFSGTRSLLDKLSQKNLGPVRLSPEMTNSVERKTFGIFPWEISYVAANNLDYRPFPVFQTDNAYTPYLDKLNADFLENGETAPELILMEWKSVDRRHPLIDTPALWLSMYKWYDTAEKTGGFILLKRRAQPRFTRLEHMEMRTCGFGDAVELPDADHPVIVTVRGSLTPYGSLMKFFFRVPEIRIVLDTASDRQEGYRVIPETLSGGLLLNILPFSLDDTAELLSGTAPETRTGAFRMQGEGLHLYDETMTVEFLRPAGMLADH